MIIAAEFETQLAIWPQAAAWKLAQFFTLLWVHLGHP
jgi:hypothetical protein